jgi:integrase/recombinase XerC
MYMARTERSDLTLSEERSLTAAIFEYWAFLKASQNVTKSSMNNNLTAISNFCEYLGLKQLNIKALRENIPVSPHRTLSAEEQNLFLDAVNMRQSSRDQAIALLFFNTGIRIGECVALNVEDVVITAHTGRLIIRPNGSDSCCPRELHLDEATRKALLNWLRNRENLYPNHAENALFLNVRGQRLAIPGLDFVIRSIGWRARLELSAQILRRTFLVNQLNSGVHSSHALAQIAGHKRPETIRRYIGRPAGPAESSLHMSSH